jgi:hypothetical protein
MARRCRAIQSPSRASRVRRSGRRRVKGDRCGLHDDLPGDDQQFAGGDVEFVDEQVFAGRQLDDDEGLGAGREDFLDMQVGVLEFERPRPFVLEDELDALPGRYVEPLRRRTRRP